MTCSVDGLITSIASPLDPSVQAPSMYSCLSMSESSLRDHLSPSDGNTFTDDGRALVQGAFVAARPRVSASSETRSCEHVLGSSAGKRSALEPLPPARRPL